MARGTFILSLDCEGKWGVADGLTPELAERLTDARLRDAYAAVRQILDEYEIPATFAVVGLFEASAAQLARLPHQEVAARLPYTSFAMQDLAQGRFGGWSAEWIGEMIRVSDEWAMHGVTHTPFDTLDTPQAEYELSLADGRRWSTIIFPRNRIGHLALLRQHGLVGYRLARSDSVVTRFASEVWPYASADPHPGPAAAGLPQAIPAGRFLNWKHGVRRFVPTEITRVRARHVMRDAAANDRVAHFWLHPENIATAPATLSNLRAVCAEAAILRDAGKLVIVTQDQYVARHSELAS